jgi:hypothetical protein
MDIGYGTLALIDGDSNSIQGFDFEVDAQNKDPKIEFSPGSKNNRLSEGSIRFNAFAEFCLLDTDGNDDNIGNSIESVDIDYKDSIPAQSLSSENCIINRKVKTQIRDVNYRIFDGATEDSFLFNEGNFCCVENCRLEVFDGVSFDETSQSRYTDIDVIVRGVTGTSKSNRDMFTVDTAGVDITNILFESITMRNTWNPSASSSEKLSVVPWTIGNGTDGVMIRDCSVEADVNIEHSQGVPYDPQKDSQSANLFVIDNGGSSDGTKDTLMLESGDKGNSSDGFALWELTALPPL